MPYTSLRIQPGIDVEQSPLLNEAGFSFSQNVRFFSGLPQKGGGWAQLTATPLIGTCRGMHAWGDLFGNPFLAAGTEQRLMALNGTALLDITPLQATTNPTPAFSTQAGSTLVSIRDPGGPGGVPGNWINIVVPVSVGGLLISGFFALTALPSPGVYQITAGVAATTTSTLGGAVANFQTVNGSPLVTVNLANHGQTMGSNFFVQIPTVVGGLTLTGALVVTAVNSPNQFVVNAGSPATSNAGPIGENGGNTQIQYLIPNGLVSTTQVQAGGFGVGPYGAGPYGVGTSGLVTAHARQWFLDNFGQDLIGNYTGSPVFVWTPPTGAALAVNTTNFPGALSPPVQVNYSFVSAPQQMLIVLGADIIGSGGQFDPLLVRWCNAGDFTNWYPTVTNQAGSFRIPAGSKLTGGISAANFNVLWTDTDMWLMSYLAGQLIWGFTKIATGVDLLAAHGAGAYRNFIYWLSTNGFFVFDGNTVQQIPCPVWDKFWRNLNLVQSDKINCQVNSLFQEVSWAFPSAAGNGEVDSRITYNIRDNVWTYDDMVAGQPAQTARTAWIDTNVVVAAPVGVDLSGLLQAHDVAGVNDANGAALISSVRTGWFSVQEGSFVAFMERLVEDFIVQGGDQTVMVTVLAQDYPNGPVRTYGPFSWTPARVVPWDIVRARGRFFSIQIASSGLGSFWRLGNLRYTASIAGRRP